MKSLEELQALRDQMKDQMGIRHDAKDNIRVVVGMATCGIAAGARPVLQRLTEEVAKRGLKNVTVAQTGCIGICQYEPVVEVFENGKEKVTYVKMTEDKIVQVVAEHLVNGTHCRIHHRRGSGRSQGLTGGTAKRCIVHMYWCAEAPAVPPPGSLARIVRALENNIKSVGLEDEVKVIRTGCFGLCALGPIMIVYPEGAFYSRVNVDDVPEIVEEHLLKGRVVKRLLYQETVQEDTIKSLDQTDFYKKQMRVALKNCGVIDPENINEYIAYDGYAALGKVLTEMTPEEVIKTVKDSRGPARTGRRRLPHRPEVELWCRFQGRSEICGLQRRRG